MMRLDKLLAHSGYGSRKDVSKLVKAKLVEVNGKVITKADYKIDEYNDEIVVDGFILEYVKNVYIMFNKPSGYVSASVDNVHPTVMDLIPEYNYLDLFCVGRLDLDTTGLLLITNDGSWAHSISNAKKKVEKEYHALIDGLLSTNNIANLEKGVIIENDYLTKPAKLKVIENYDDTSLVSIIITEGKFHQVKQMFASQGFEVLKLHRSRIKNLELDKSLEFGDYTLLTDNQIAELIL
ncbi:pseudouridine synthase [Mycoplasma sp. P36-A1]|uniref:pseudouridine synthase n=1 Tax=Mycoplasma sp. P36-A1 TaxID=3252900 RepID=UPI003C2B3DBC